MVRWVEIDRQGLAAAGAAACIYRYYHPVCNAGDVPWRQTIMLQQENDITSKREGQMIKTLRLLSKLYFSCPFWNKTSSLQVWCQILFENWIWETFMSSLLPGPSRIPTGVLFFWQVVYRVCIPAVFTQTQPSTQWEMMEWGLTGKSAAGVLIPGKPSLIERHGNCLIAKFVMLRKKKEV